MSWADAKSTIFQSYLKSLVRRCYSCWRNYLTVRSNIQYTDSPLNLMTIATSEFLFRPCISNPWAIHRPIAYVFPLINLSTKMHKYCPCEHQRSSSAYKHIHANCAKVKSLSTMPQFLAWVISVQPELQIRRGTEDNSKIIFPISQRKRMLWPLIKTVSARRF